MLTRSQRLNRAMKAALALSAVLVLGTGLAVILEAAGTLPDGIPSPLRSQTRAPSTYVDARVLAANVAETVTVPTFASPSPGRGVPLLAVFSSTCSNWYYSVTGTAAAPVADVTDGSASARAPTALRFDQADTFSVVADATCTLTIEYYRERGGD